MFSRLTRVSKFTKNALLAPMRNVTLMRPQYRTLYSINVGDLMKKMNQPAILSIAQNERIRNAAQTMETKKVGALVVCDSSTDDTMVGIVTARDVQQAVAEYPETELHGVSVKDVMTPSSRVKTASLNDNLENVATTMIDSNIRHIPVMNKEGKNCGILSIKDVVRVVLDDERQEISQYKRIVSDSYSADPN